MAGDVTFEYPVGATPLDPDEAEGLIPQNVTTQAELNQCEQANILLAEIWLSQSSFKIENVLNADFMRRLHKRMFANVWRWSGSFRRSGKNIGVDWQTIPMKLKNLVDDVEFQIKNKIYSNDEIAARFHHRLVLIHLFPNGNGRHARMMTDILLLALNQPRFSWGSSLESSRKVYLSALRQADKGVFDALFEFVRL